MKKLIALTFVLSCLFTSCNSEDQPVTWLKEAYTESVAGASTATVNQEIMINVTYKVDYDCGNFNEFYQSQSADGFTRTIAIQAKYIEENCGVTPVSKVVPYKFKAAAAGTYTLKFKKSSTTFVTHTVVVE